MTRQDTADSIDAQERELILKSFTNDDAWNLGCQLRDRALARKAPVAVQVRRGTTTLFLSLLEGATADNLDWLRRKIAVAERFERSSYAITLMLEEQKTTLSDRYGLTLQDYAASGGAVPVRLSGVGVVGSAAMSGLAGEEDHALVCEALASLRSL